MVKGRKTRIVEGQPTSPPVRYLSPPQRRNLSQGIRLLFFCIDKFTKKCYTILYCKDSISEVSVMSYFKSYKFHCLVAHIVLIIECACSLKGCTTSNNLWVSLFLWAAMVLSAHIIYHRLLPVSLRKNLLSPLFDELNVEKFRARFSGKFGDLPLATEVIYESFLTNNVQQIIDICTSYINKKCSKINVPVSACPRVLLYGK